MADLVIAHGQRTDSRWATLVSACLGWMFDAMDLQIFTLILFPCVSELIGTRNLGQVAWIGGIILACKLVAWGFGGIVFGVVADRIGRSRTMIITVLIYAAFTGLSGFAQSWQQLAILQALAGIGIGGEWAAGAALVAETWPDRTRARAMQVMQMSFAFGFFLAALINLTVGPYGWRYVLFIGTVPALLTLPIRRYVPEPERWLRVRDQQIAAGTRASAGATFAAIFTPEFRRRTIVGVLVASTMMIGAWGASTLIPIWVNQLVGPGQRLAAIRATSGCFMLSNVGAVLGYLALIWMTDALGRRWSYFLIVVGCAGIMAAMFTQVHALATLQWFMVPYGFFTVGGFGTFATYLPELFPTRIRATGQGFCWNMARAFTAVGPFVSGMLVSEFGSVPSAGLTIVWIYAIGMIAIWFGPETRGVPLAD
ncbi:MAG TPA: MFS transporter [Acetobacteraceae bacterium]|nr:MFS transporter [Acetobacteraceae bacterium]